MDNPVSPAPSRERILAAARQEFLRVGFNGARMQHIANEAGINKALLHYYYQSKENLFELVMGDALSAFIQKVQSVFAGQGSVLEKIEWYLEAHLQLLLEQPDLPLFVISESHRDPDGFFNRFFDSNKGLSPFGSFMNQIKQEMREGKIRTMDPIHLWMHVMSMTVFPFAAKPMLQRLTGVDAPEYRTILMERKNHILGFITLALAQPNS